MSTAFQTPLALIHQAVARWPSSPAFKIPIVGDGSGFGSYTVITYTEFEAEVLCYAKYWSQKLSKDQVPPGEVVSICLEGYRYTDLLHIFGLLRAGFVVHCFGSFPGSADVLASLLQQVGSRAFIFERGWFDPTFLQTKNSAKHIKFYPSLNTRKLPDQDETYGYEEYEIPNLHDVDPEQTVIIYHTSGSISGTPKVTPYNHRQLNTLILKARFFVVPSDCDGGGNCQETWSWLGRSTYIGQFTRIMNAMHYGCSTIQRIPNSPTELRSMVEFGGLDRALMFPALLTKLLRQSREDSGLLAVLVSLKGIHFSGGAVPQFELQYAKKAGINIKISFASNECSMTLVSKEFRSKDVDDEPGYLHPITTVIGGEGLQLFEHRFLPYEGGELKELVVLPTSADCPHKSFCNLDDGRHYTGDLFEEVPSEIDSGPKRYLFRGRKDDWIKMEKAAKCDAGAIENDVRKTCDDLVLECVVVGTCRPSPALIIEPKDNTVIGMETRQTELKDEIFCRITRLDSHTKRLAHERIENPGRIIVVPPHSLIRTATKGNVCRHETEEAFEKELDRAYGLLDL
ncbi:acetyl-CoA synthetase-like protein [Marasmius fiardii PR-910]|nr:acetyl-CoA synthetase-like protein [Marasmius fiardii PR-910]